MQSKLLNQSGGERTFALIFDIGDEVLPKVEQFASDQKITADQITGIGAFSDVVLRYFDWDSKEYFDNKVDEQVEVASLVGDIGKKPDGKPAVHIHLVVGKRDGSAMAGHLGPAHVRPTLELIVTESPEHLQRCKDEETGLPLIDLDA
jgi:predicted DNA-binding protein with PD1-like motif